ncbi:hypothetical protein [Planomonospora venezuelensis]|uniref:Uncharacterized protein n=1 Tax=Planomonospora venezuelensis TaxID=1999 RepID=A0A841DGW6_PLAVE|nr:hypothetical protein [Planomonospora venezuelensis]MBB5967624.1 hypothetical protein [Planomonospora venezuelensis]GIN00276.1 hypothetical protein Pve01_19340 [Planomonospora venezuelensis]
MKRRTVALAIAVPLVLAAAVIVTVVLRSAAAPAAAVSGGVPAAPAGTAEPVADARSQRTGEQTAGTDAPRTPEEIYLAATAAHLCAVQSTVYSDPKEMAEAYAAAPEYPGLTGGQISELDRRLDGDAAFSARLTQRLADTCRPAAAP